MPGRKRSDRDKDFQCKRCSAVTRGPIVGEETGFWQGDGEEEAVLPTEIEVSRFRRPGAELLS